MGANVALWDRDDGAAHAVASDLESSGRCARAFHCDVARSADVAGALTATLFGSSDFLGGLASRRSPALWITTVVYAWMFSAHMAQHMLLVMLVPIFLVLGAPFTLALRTLPRNPGQLGPRE